MSAFDEIIAAATETTDSQVLKPLVAVLYVCIMSYLIWTVTSAEQRLNATGNRRGKGANMKTSQSKPKKSTSGTVRMKDNIKNKRTAQLQICSGSGPKSDTIIYDIKRSSNQKMEHRRLEGDFIIVVSKRERRRLQQEKIEKEQQLKTQKQQIKQGKQAQEKLYQSNQLRHNKSLKQKNSIPFNSDVVTAPIVPKKTVVVNKSPQNNDKKSQTNVTEKLLVVENNDLEKALLIKDDKEVKVLQAEQERTKNLRVNDDNVLAISSLGGKNMRQRIQHRQDEQKDSEKELELKKQQQKKQDKQQQKPQGLKKQQEQKNQEERKKIEKQQEKQQQLKKKQSQEKQQRHDNLLQQETPATNDITATLTKSPKIAVLLAERDVQLDEMQAKNSMMKNVIYTNLENWAASQSTQVFHDAVVGATGIDNLLSTRNSDKNNEDLEHLKIEIATKDTYKNIKRCKEHDSMIKDLREENKNMREQYELSMKNNWTDSEFKIVLEGVRAEIEIKRLDAIKKLTEDHQVMLVELRTEHDLEVNGLHMYYQSMLSNLQMDHDIEIGAIHMKHDKLINNLRNINYDQSQRYETAMQSMRQVRDKTSKEHQNEVRGLREKYENTIKDHEIAIKDLIKEKELLRAEHEKMCEKNEDQYHTTIKTITNTRIATIANDNAIDELKTINSTLNHTVVD